MIEYFYYLWKMREYYATAKTVYDGYRYFMIARKYSKYLTCLLPEQRPIVRKKRQNIIEIREEENDWDVINIVC